MSKVWRNFAIDVVLVLQVVALATTGAIMKWALPPGSGGRGWRGGMGLGGPRTLLGMTRHDWGDVHFWIAVGLVVAIGLHLAVHWRWIVCRVRDLHLAGRHARTACDDDAA
jgi:hypothetical protein